MAWTTYGVRDGSRGETNDKLSRRESTWGLMSQVKTHPAPAIVEDHERGNEIFVERFMNSIRSDCENAIANDLETRYHELDNVQNDIIQFGNYLQAEQCTGEALYQSSGMRLTATSRHALTLGRL